MFQFVPTDSFPTTAYLRERTDSISRVPCCYAAEDMRSPLTLLLFRMNETHFSQPFLLSLPQFPNHCGDPLLDLLQYDNVLLVMAQTGPLLQRQSCKCHIQ